jgi:diguanylate cyclase (GGDEF)-like protein
VAVILIIASGRLLHSSSSEGDLSFVLIAAGIFLVSAALAVTTQKKSRKPSDRLIIYWVCAGIMISVQLTGGSSSLFYSGYLLFLMWVSLPSTGSEATELGLLIGSVEALALLNVSIWSGEGALLTKLIPLLLPALKALLVPFLFGLVADWLAERELFLNEIAPPGRKKGEETDDISSKTGTILSYPLLTIIQRNSNADSTCLFIQYDDGFYRLENFVARDNSVIDRYMLPSDHRLLRIVKNSKEPVSIKAGSYTERSELAPYRLTTLKDEKAFWIVICCLGNADNPAGFLLQDFYGDKPSSETVRNLENAAEVLHMNVMNTGINSLSTEKSSWMAKLVSAAGMDSLDASVHGIASLLSEIIPGSTVSIADVNHENKEIRVWVSRGPLARWRRKRVSSSSEGLAGWIVKNRVPCKRSGMKHGERNVSSFSNEEDLNLRVGSCMGVPVMRNNEVLAVIIVEHEDDKVFDQYHESIILAAAGLFALTDELADLRNRFRNISGRDTLTGLPGITLFDRHLHEMAKRVQTYGWSIGVLIADIDGFDLINRNHGYSEGDKILKEAAARFSNCFSDEILISRTGPDSFAACIPKAGKAEMEALSQRVADALSWQYVSRTSDTQISITASIGGCFTHVNRKVQQLTGEAENTAAEVFKAGYGNCLIHKLGLTDTAPRD